MTSYCFRIYEDLHRFEHKFVFVKIVSEQDCSEIITILRSYAANFLQICANLQKSWNNMMSNDGLIIEYMDLSNIHLVVALIFTFNLLKKIWEILSLISVLLKCLACQIFKLKIIQQWNKKLDLSKKRLNFNCQPAILYLKLFFILSRTKSRIQCYKCHL